ncbi:MAG TPA: hypothetical protein VGH10_11505 [Actinomycetota bacterium]|jgi:hypothetical protein
MRGDVETEAIHDLPVRLAADTALVYRCRICDAVAEEPYCPGCHTAAIELRALADEFTARRSLEAEPVARTLPRQRHAMVGGEAIATRRPSESARPR